MPRIVKRTKTQPYQLKPEDSDKTLCQCGLSRNQPFYNSHLLTQGEEPGKTYWYDDAGGRHLFPVETPRGIRTF